MIELQEIFDVRYGTNLALNSLSIDESGVNFVSRTSKNNGVSAKIARIPNVNPINSGVLTVAGGGSVLETFLQNSPFYSGRDLYYLVPKFELTTAQKIYYTLCIKANKYRYNYGRQANKTLKTLLIPSIDEIPDWVNNFDISKYEHAHRPLLKKTPQKLDFKSWKYFTFSDIFFIKQGYYNKKPPKSQNKNDIPFIGASEYDNGITSYVKEADVRKYSRDGKIINNESLDKKVFQPPCITVANDGASVSEAFYQTKEFTCSHSVNILYLKNKKISPGIGLFISTLIRQEKYRWSYGRKWRPARMEKSKIKLPVDNDGNPDWQFMESYTKSLPYSSSL